MSRDAMLETMNYYGDRRVQAGMVGKWYEKIDEENMVAHVEIGANLDNGEAEELGLPEEILVKVPIKFAICQTCAGRGKHVNPSIDCGGITEDDFDREPDFREEYMSGRYDQVCNECGGKRVVPELDRERTDPKIVAAIDQQIKDAYDDMRERAAELRFGC